MKMQLRLKRPEKLDRNTGYLRELVDMRGHFEKYHRGQHVRAITISLAHLSAISTRFFTHL